MKRQFWYIAPKRPDGQQPDPANMYPGMIFFSEGQARDFWNERKFDRTYWAVFSAVAVFGEEEAK